MSASTNWSGGLGARSPLLQKRMPDGTLVTPARPKRAAPSDADVSWWVERVKFYLRRDFLAVRAIEFAAEDLHNLRPR